MPKLSTPLDLTHPLALTALGLACLLSACTEPVDCARQPERCRGVQTRADRPTPAQQPATRAGTTERPGEAPADRKDADPDLLRRLRLGTEVDAEERRLGDLAGSERSTATPELLIRRLRNVGANRNLQGLKRYVTPELAAQITVRAAEQPDRFWRHIERYVSAAEHGFEISSRRGSPEVGLQLQIEARGDIHLRPVVVRTKEGYRFQRF